MRLAHFSDPHLLSLEGSRMRDFLNKRWIGGMNLLLKRARQHSAKVFEALVADLAEQAVDHAVCTGDVTSLSLPSEARFAATWFSRIPLDASRLTVIPGNHDDYVAGGAELFAHHFGANFAADSDWSWPDESPWPAVRVRGNVAVIALSTSLVTPWFRAWGRVGMDQLARLEQVLTSLRLADKLRVVILHHPPVGKPARSRGAGLRDHQALAEVLAASGAELVLHGHEHLDLQGEIPSPDPAHPAIPVRGIPSITFVGRRRAMRAGYRIYEIGARAGASSTTPRRPTISGVTLRSWDPESQRFRNVE